MGEGEPVRGGDRLPGSPEKRVEAFPATGWWVFPETQLHPPPYWASAPWRPLRARVAQLGGGGPRRAAGRPGGAPNWCVDSEVCCLARKVAPQWSDTGVGSNAHTLGGFDETFCGTR